MARKGKHNGNHIQRPGAEKAPARVEQECGVHGRSPGGMYLQGGAWRGGSRSPHSMQP